MTGHHPALDSLDGDVDEVTTRYMPPQTSREFPRWLFLHGFHLQALARDDLRLACNLADAKYMVYLRAVAPSRLPPSEK